MAHSVRACHNSFSRFLQIRSKPDRAAMAVGYLGERIRCDRMARGFSPVLMVRGELWHYNKTYGSLGAVIGFMTWIWISIIVVLVGAKLNAEMEHQTIRESTIGQPKPLGKRGARMADTVGATQA